MGQTPPKYFLPSSPYGASPGANTVNPTQPGAMNPQQPLLPPNFQDPGTMQQQIAPTTGQGAMPRPTNNPMDYRQLMQGLFRIAILLLLPFSSWATTTVTGNVQNLGTGTVGGSGAFVRFWLRGCGGNQPRINGTSIIAPSQGGVFYFDLAANSSGVVSGTIYSTRDATGLLGGDIECGGSKTAVWYGMQIWNAGKAGPEVPVHALNGSTLDITAVVPITVNPVITAPTGDSTYVRLDAGNSPVTGTLTDTATGGFRGNINNRFAAGPGATPTIATQEAAAIAAGGGVVEISPGYTGAESANCSMNGSDGTNTWSGNSTVLIVDWRSGSPTCEYSIQFNGATPYGLAPFGATKYFISPANTASAAILTAKYSGNLSVAGDLNGATTETDVIGSVTANPGAIMTAHIMEFHPRSTGGTIANAAVLLTGFAIDRTTVTTNVTNAFNLLTQSCGNISSSGATIANCVSVFGAHNTLGTNSNYSFVSDGRTRFDYFSGDNGFDFQNISGTAINVLQNDGADTLAFHPLSDVKGYVFKGTSGNSVLELDRNVPGIGIGGGISTQAPASGNTGFQHIRVAGCATAASLNATCDTTVTWTSAFLNTSYTATCTGDVVTSGVPIIEGIDISAAKTASAITVRTISITAAAAQFTTIDCTAVHD